MCQVKRVLVSMTPESHRVLKQYCALHGITMSEFLFSCARNQIHKHALDSKIVFDIIEQNNISLDKRCYKDCIGFRCFDCVELARCRIGAYLGSYIKKSNNVIFDTNY